MGLNYNVSNSVLLKFITCVCFLLFCRGAVCQNKLQDAVYNIVRNEDFRFGSLSICIIDLEKDSIVASYQPYTSLVPASTVKLLTTYAALSILGPNFRFKTELQYGGEFLDSTLNGCIFIKGWGDPTLGSARFPRVDNIHSLMKQFSKAIKKECVFKINGYVVGDGTYFEQLSIPNTWQYDDIGNYYGSGVHGLNFHDNEFSLFFKQTPAMWERPSIERVYPEMSDVHFENRVTSGPPKSGDNSNIFGEPLGKTRYVQGTIPAGNGRFTIRGSISNPPLTCAESLVRAFTNEKCSVSGGAIDYNTYLKTVGTPLTRHTFYTYSSPKLSDIILQTNHRSVNLYAETLLREMGKVKYEEGTTDAGVKALYEFWKDKGLTIQGLFLEDGSGLSPRNGISSWHFAKALSIARKDTANFITYFNSLPVAGKEGTVRKLLSNYKGTAEVRVKSGTMKRIKSYCGYVIDPNGKQFAFAFIANNYSCPGSEVRNQVENLLQVLLQQ
ncbi:MAG: D-alanyl-D-alanine carboxypeptidase/D-alanyl-D-alanine-endopeptidase [Saprospiraceae bacterium]|jgi:D-alanyl-D-alanine carboxypeptidase/D-alanyl-D-alanine-endopeptidase (penicillin-binding protein 4)|nr:D-alanyl-D-alanine carboxypeptidase/D-alanyl-D-alanine-endopeptidase [Saprospiraceae bacterium]